jgi:cysteine desulfurase
VLEAILPFYHEKYGNPSSMHNFGGQLASDIKIARGQVANLMNANESEVVFTSGGTESDNAAIRGVLEAYPEKKHLITTRVEHPAILSLFNHLEKRGYQTTYLSVDSKGRLDIQQLQEAIRPDTAIVSVMFGNNETGTIFPIAKIAEIVKQHGVIFHTDAVQTAGKIQLNMKELPVDLVSISGHKIHAPKGCGALYIRRGTRFVPFIIGGHQERGRRGGTENVAGIVGLGKACEIAARNMPADVAKVSGLRDKLEQGILKNIPEILLNGDAENRLPTTTNLSFSYIEGEAILLKLSALGICASSGSACTSGSLEPSHVLRAMGIPFTSIHGSIRFSFSKYNTAEEVDYVLHNLPPIIAELRSMSPFWEKRDR